jgi:ribosome-binding ATPase
LTNIRECDAICHVVRDFADENIIKEGSTDPQGDFEVICAELIIKDLETIDKYIHQNQNKPEDPKKLALAKKLKIGLEQAKLAQNIELDDDEKILIKSIFSLDIQTLFYSF